MVLVQRREQLDWGGGGWGIIKKSTIQEKYLDLLIQTT